MRRRRLTASLFAALMLLTITSVPAHASVPTTVTPLHDVVCISTIGTPFKATATAVGVIGEVECNYSPDAAVTTVQLQRIVNGVFQNFGNPVSSSSTATYLSIYDGAGVSSGCHRFRGRIHREAFHGTWGYTTKYGTPVTLCF
jgi:hypothetical protein